jgi:bacterial/archaeal transporter family protein
MTNDCQLLLFSGLAILMWGLWGFFGKLALDGKMEPAAIFLAEVLVSLICALAVLFVILRKNDLSLHFSWNIFGLVSGAGLALGILFYYLALEKGHVYIVVPLAAIYPIIAVLLSYAILNEKPNLLQWIGIILVIAGTTLLLSGPLSKVSGSTKSLAGTAPNMENGANKAPTCSTKTNASNSQYISTFPNR